MTNNIRLLGMKVNITRDVITPNIRIMTDIQMTDAVRNSVNNWLKETFGFKTSNLMKDGEVIKTSHLGEEFLFMNQHTFDQIKRNIDSLQAKNHGFKQNYQP